MVLSRTESKREADTEKKDLLTELSDLKADYEKGLKANKGRTAVGLSTIETGLFHEVMEFLRQYSAGELEDSVLRPQHFSLGHFVRYCVDDLKSYYLESRIAVKPEAIQNLRDLPVVFVKQRNYFEGRPIELGVSNANWIEVLSGLSFGEEYAVKNSFTIKAEIEKSEATHSH